MSVTSGCAWHWMPRRAADQKSVAENPPLYPPLPSHFPSSAHRFPNPKTNERCLHICLRVVWVSGIFTLFLIFFKKKVFFSFFFFWLLSVQSPFMETPQINLCSTVVPVEQQSTESPSMATGLRRFIPKTIHVRTNLSLFLINIISLPKHKVPLLPATWCRLSHQTVALPDSWIY